MIGKLVASEPGVGYAALFYKPLAKVTDYQLRINKGNIDCFMELSKETKGHIQWWINHIPYTVKTVMRSSPQYVIFTYASKLGSGAINKSTGDKTGGRWSPSEKDLHINILELKSCQFALMSCFNDLHDVHIRVNMDNSVSVAYLNNFWGRTHQLDALARRIWLWCLDRNIHVSAALWREKLTLKLMSFLGKIFKMI